MSTIERLSLLITADGAGAVRELDKVGKSASKNLTGAEKGVDRFAGSLIKGGAAATIAGVGILKGLQTAADGAQGLADSVDRANSVFGSSSALAEWAAKAADNLGLSKDAALDTAAGYGVLLKESGETGAQLVKDAQALANTTVDLAELYKLDPAEVEAKIGAALQKGTAKSLLALKPLGINLTPAQIDTKAVELGIAKAGDKLSTSQRVRVIAQLIPQNPAAGEFKRSLDEGDIGAKQAVAAANLKNNIADFGKSAVPVLAKVTDLAVGLLHLFEKIPGSENIAGILAIGAAAGVVLGPIVTLGGGLLKVGSYLNGLGASKVGALVTAADVAATETLAAAQATAATTATALATAETELAVAVQTYGVGSAEAVAATLALETAQGGATVAAEALAVAETEAGAAGVAAAEASGIAWGKVAGAIGLAVIAGGIALNELSDAKQKAIEIVGIKPEDVTGTVDPAVPEYVKTYRRKALLTKVTAPPPKDETFANTPSADEILQANIKTAAAVLPSLGVDQARKLVEDLNKELQSDFGKSAEDAKKFTGPLQDVINKMDLAARVGKAAAGGIGGLGDDAKGAAEKVSTLGKALADANGDISQLSVADKFSFLDPIEKLIDADKRLAKANRDVAAAAEQDSQRIADSYQSLVDAKQRLDDALHPDDGTFGLKHESAQTQIDDAKQRLTSANQKLSVNENDPSAITAKDLAIGDLERATARRQDDIRNAKSQAKAVEAARKDVERAQKNYEEQLKNPSTAQDAANAELASATRDRVKAELEFAGLVKDAGGDLATVKTDLDALAAEGLIPQKLADDLKTAIDKMGQAALDFADKVAGISTPGQVGESYTKAAQGRTVQDVLKRTGSLFGVDIGGGGGGGTGGGSAPAAPTTPAAPTLPTKSGSRVPKDTPGFPSGAVSPDVVVLGGYAWSLTTGGQWVNQGETNGPDRTWVHGGKTQRYATGGIVAATSASTVEPQRYALGGTADFAQQPMGLGGQVPGSGTGDIVPAMLTPGEFVVRKSAVEAIGIDRLAALNASTGGTVPKFATGGLVGFPRPTTFAPSYTRDTPESGVRGGDTSAVTFSPTIYMSVPTPDRAGQAVISEMRELAHRSGRGIRVTNRVG